ncbi:MAG TPA: amidohydrolase family protein [Gammaproteobacteria bacterium]|nr:amidohydrolase family protein [Gammaproteobacteria bacterium]
MKICIQNGRLIDPFQKLDAIQDLYIDNHTIVALGKPPQGFTPQRVIDAQGKVVIPGLFDLCCRFPKLGLQSKLTLQKELTAIKKSGITQFCLPPTLNHTKPIYPIDELANQLGVKCFPIGPLTQNLEGLNISDLTALLESGCIAFSNDTMAISDLDFLKKCYDYAATFGCKIIIQPSESRLSAGRYAHEGQISTRLGLPGIPKIAETIAIAQHLLLIEKTGISAHFSKISTQEGVEQIRKAKAQGLPITADTTMHHLILTEMDVQEFNPACHVTPPLRSHRDQMGLIQGIKTGVLDAICSDHTPLDITEKLAPFGQTSPGFSAIETFFSVGVHLVNQGHFDLFTLIQAMTVGPSKAMGLPSPTLAVGNKANLFLADLDQYWQVNANNFQSTGHHSPFDGWELPGKIIEVF